MGKPFIADKTPIKEMIKQKPQGKLVNSKDKKLEVQKERQYLPVRGNGI
jgi:hypothetical protein